MKIESIYLEFGGGETPSFPKYKQVDIRDLPKVDIVCKAWKIAEHVSANSVEHIFSRHFFEHLTFRQCELFVAASGKILKPKGRFEAILPNMEWHVRQWLTEENIGNFVVDQPFERAMEGLWGKQRGTIDDTWDLHKSGYKKWQIERLFEVRGFSKVEWQKPSWKNMHFIAIK